MIRSSAIRFSLVLLASAAQLLGCAGNTLPENPATGPKGSGQGGTVTTQQAEAATPQPQKKPLVETSAYFLPANPEESIFFSPGSHVIASAERRKLKPLADRLRADRRQTVTLVGHANDNGSPSFNLAVADARIAEVASAMKKLGVATHQIRKQALGEERLPADCRSSECRRAMRRVDFVFSGPADGK